MIDAYLCTWIRDVAQLVAHTSGGREVASSSLVIPTIQSEGELSALLFSFQQMETEIYNTAHGKHLRDICNLKLAAFCHEEKLFLITGACILHVILSLFIQSFYA